MEELFTLTRIANRPSPGIDDIREACALIGDVIHSAVDAKPKRTRRLRRLANIAANPRVTVLADHYEDDWSRLWWVRADGVARILDDSPAGVAALIARYPQYRRSPPPGPFLEITVERWSAWSP